MCNSEHGHTTPDEGLTGSSIAAPKTDQHSAGQEQTAAAIAAMAVSQQVSLHAPWPEMMLLHDSRCQLLARCPEVHCSRCLHWLLAGRRSHLFPALTSDCGTQAYRACAKSVLTPKPDASSPAAHVSSQVVSTDACAVRVMSSLASKHIQANAGTASNWFRCQMTQVGGPCGAFQPALNPAHLEHLQQTPNSAQIRLQWLCQLRKGWVWF